jgi:hypothetical protein
MESQSLPAMCDFGNDNGYYTFIIQITLLGHCIPYKQDAMYIGLLCPSSWGLQLAAD